MEGCIFREENGIITINEDALSLCPKLRQLDHEHVEYIILVHDHFDSPLWKKPEPERKRLATRKIWGKSDYDPEGENGKITKAHIKEIKALTYSDPTSTIAVYRDKIHFMNEQLYSEQDPIKVGKITSALTAIQQMLSDIEKSFNKSKELVQIKGGKTLSFLELKHRQMRESVKNRR